MVTLTVTDGTLYGDGRGNFEIEDLSQLLTSKELEEYENERDELKADGNEGNFKELYDMTILDGGIALHIKFYIQRASSPLVRARFKSKVGAANKYDHQPYLRKKFNVGDVITLEKTGNKIFKII